MNIRRQIRSAARNIMKLASSMLETVESAPLSLGNFSITFTMIIIVRILVDFGTQSFRSEPLSYILYEFSHTYLFFLFSFLMFLPIIRLAGASSWRRGANLLLVGFLIIWTPPVIDKLIFGNGLYWSFYELDGIKGLIVNFFRFFNDNPSIGITYGVRAEVAIMSIGLGLYAFKKSKEISRACGIAVLSYLAFYILGTFPSYIAIPALAAHKGLFAVTNIDIAGLMLSPKSFFGNVFADPRMTLGYRMSLVYSLLITFSLGVFLFKSSKKTFFALLRNVRWPQVIWHGGLLFLGGGIAVLYAGAEPDFSLFEILSIIVMAVAVECAWLASVIGNDLADRRIDAISNPNRPVPMHSITETLYRHIGIIFFATSLLFSAIVNIKAALFLLAYQAIAWMYSMPPLRLKRVPVLATALSALDGIMVLLAGYTVLSPVQNITPIPFSLLVYLFVCYAVTLPLKDFKDIAGDRSDGVFTIPVIFGEERARFLIGSALFACYVASPLVLHEVGLFLPSLLFGSLAFISVRRAGQNNNKWSSFRSLPAWNIAFVTLYGLITVTILLF